MLIHLTAKIPKSDEFRNAIVALSGAFVQAPAQIVIDTWSNTWLFVLLFRNANTHTQTHSVVVDIIYGPFHRQDPCPSIYASMSTEALNIHRQFYNMFWWLTKYLLRLLFPNQQKNENSIIFGFKFMVTSLITSIWNQNWNQNSIIHTKFQRKNIKIIDIK